MRFFLPLLGVLDLAFFFLCLPGEECRGEDSSSSAEAEVEVDLGLSGEGG